MIKSSVLADIANKFCDRAAETTLIPALDCTSTLSSWLVAPGKGVEGGEGRREGRATHKNMQEKQKIIVLLFRAYSVSECHGRGK